MDEYEYRIYKMKAFEDPPPTIKQIFNKFCFIFMQTWGVYTTWWSGNTNKNIFVKIFHLIRISNIFVPRNLTKYEYWIYLFLTTWPNTNIEYICSSLSYWIRISNIFVLSKLAEYKYWIYIRNQKIKYSYLNILIFGA